MLLCLVALLLAACNAQQELSSSQDVQVGEREPFFFFTLTYTVTATTLTTSTSTLSTALTCTSSTACSGKRRRRRGILELGDEEETFDSIFHRQAADERERAQIEPKTREEPSEAIEASAVQTVEVTQVPEAKIQGKRQGREAQFFHDLFHPLMPSYFHANVNPRFNPYFGVPNYFRKDSKAANVQPAERFLFSFSTTTSTLTVTSTTTTITATTKLLVCTTGLVASISAC